MNRFWKKIRKRGSKNEIFATLEKLVDRPCDTICSLECSVDDLLCDSLISERETFESQLVDISKDCTPKELGMLTDMARAMKDSMRKREYDT